MGVIAKDSGGADFQLPEVGPCTAVCDMVVDLGLQPNSYNMDKPKHKVYMRFQLPSQRIQYDKDGKHHDLPMVVGTMLTVSLSKKAILRGFLESWRGRAFTETELQGFDLFNVVGVPCMVNIVHNQDGDKTYANIASIIPLPKGMEKPALEGKAVKYAPDEPADYERLPEWIRKKIDAAVPEKRPTTAGAPADLDDSIPF